MDKGAHDLAAPGLHHWSHWGGAHTFPCFNYNSNGVPGCVFFFLKKKKGFVPLPLRLLNIISHVCYGSYALSSGS